MPKLHLIKKKSRNKSSLPQIKPTRLPGDTEDLNAVECGRQEESAPLHLLTRKDQTRLCQTYQGFLLSDNELSSASSESTFSEETQTATSPRTKIKDLREIYTDWKQHNRKYYN